MVNITKLYCGAAQPAADHLRYGHGHGAPKSAAARRPITVWNITRTCNLRCVHCYSDSYAQRYDGELTTAQAKGVLDDLAGVWRAGGAVFRGGTADPGLICSNSSPMPARQGLRVTLSTNGTLLDEAAARELHGLDLT